MQANMRTLRVHAGCYVSVDGRYKIRRHKDEIRNRWVWRVFRIQEGTFEFDRTFRTLKVAREYVSKSVSLPWEI